MDTSQIIIKSILLVTILVVTWSIMRSKGSDSGLAMRRLGMLAFAGFAAVTVIWPSLVTRLANIVGVRRGTDLLLYLLIIAFFGQMATTYRRNVRMESRLTRLARKIALNEARIRQKTEDESAEDD